MLFSVRYLKAVIHSHILTCFAEKRCVYVCIERYLLFVLPHFEFFVFFCLLYPADAKLFILFHHRLKGNFFNKHRQKSQKRQLGAF